MREIERGIIKLLQGDVPPVPQPFKWIAERLGVSEDEVLDVVKKLHREGKLTRIGAVLYHRRSGYTQNAMVCVKVEPPEAADKVAERVCESKFVTHCYMRPSLPDWDFNLYFMFHGRDRDEVEKSVKNLLKDIPEVKNFLILFSDKEFKKTSVEYV